MSVTIFPIVLTCDANYIAYTAVTIQSIALMAKTPRVSYKIYLITDGISAEEQNYLLKLLSYTKNPQVSLEFITLRKFEGDFAELQGHITLSTYFRLLIPLIFTQYDRILYLDCDLVLACDPYEFTQFDHLGDNQPFLGVHDKYVNSLILAHLTHINLYPESQITAEDFATKSEKYRNLSKKVIPTPFQPATPLKPKFPNYPNFPTEVLGHYPNLNFILSDQNYIKCTLKYYTEYLGLEYVGEYINAGVLYCNLKYLRSLKQEYALLLANKLFKKVCFSDQCYINLVNKRLSKNQHLYYLPNWCNYSLEDVSYTFEMLANEVDVLHWKSLTDQQKKQRDQLEAYLEEKQQNLHNPDYQEFRPKAPYSFKEFSSYKSISTTSTSIPPHAFSELLHDQEYLDYLYKHHRVIDLDLKLLNLQRSGLTPEEALLAEASPKSVDTFFSHNFSSFDGELDKYNVSKHLSMKGYNYKRYNTSDFLSYSHEMMNSVMLSTFIIMSKFCTEFGKSSEVRRVYQSFSQGGNVEYELMPLRPYSLTTMKTTRDLEHDLREEFYQKYKAARQAFQASHTNSSSTNSAQISNLQTNSQTNSSSTNSQTNSSLTNSPTNSSPQLKQEQAPPYFSNPTTPSIPDLKYPPGSTISSINHPHLVCYQDKFYLKPKAVIHFLSSHKPWNTLNFKNFFWWGVAITMPNINWYKNNKAPVYLNKYYNHISCFAAYFYNRPEAAILKYGELDVRGTLRDINNLWQEKITQHIALRISGYVANSNIFNNRNC